MTVLQHDVAGRGAGVVLLHSGVADLRQWDPQWEALTGQFRGVRFDRRGWGGSPLPTAPYSDAGDVIALLDELGIEQAALVGSSAGGVVAQQVASAWPERVSRLVLVCTDADGVEPTAAVRAFAEQEDRLIGQGAVDQAVELNVETFLGPDADAPTRDLVRAMQRRSFDVQLAAGDHVPRDPGPPIDLSRVAAPAYVVSGGRDLDYFTLVADSLAEQLPTACRITLPWAGHLPNLERPGEFTGLLLDILS